MRPVLAAVALLLLGGCSSRAGSEAVLRPPETRPTPAGASGAPSDPAPADQRALRRIVESPRASLYAVDVRPGPLGVTVRAWWTLRRHHRTVGAIVTSDDGMRSAAYVRGTDRAWARGRPSVLEPRPAPGMGGLMVTDVFSLQDGTRAQQGGGDGATLDPFERLARSVGGAPWRIVNVPRTQGQQAYTSGQVVLPDGRLLALLDDWSADRRGSPSTLWHGLWISEGSDWASFDPWRPSFVPALAPTGPAWGPLVAMGAALDPRQTRAGIVWVTTATGLYVSDDQARSFREIPARPPS